MCAWETVKLHSNQSLFRWFLLRFVRTEIMRLLLPAAAATLKTNRYQFFFRSLMHFTALFTSAQSNALNIRQYTRLIERRYVRSCNGKCSRNNLAKKQFRIEKSQLYIGDNGDGQSYWGANTAPSRFPFTPTILLMICFSCFVLFISNERACTNFPATRLYFQ